MSMRSVRRLPHSNSLSPAQSATFVKKLGGALPDVKMTPGTMLLVTNTTRRHTALYMGPITHIDGTCPYIRPSVRYIRTCNYRQIP